MANLRVLAIDNAARWKRAKMTRSFDAVARRLVAAKSRYLTVAKQTGVPWFIIAVIHEREASQKWDRNIAQGDPWDKPSVHYPPTPAFKSWEEAAAYALTSCAPYAAKNTDWTVGGALTLLERYNGLAYANAGAPSPYIWSGTDQYKIGKILVDHGPIEPVIDSQLGCAGMIMAMKALDKTILFADEQPIPDAPPVETPPQDDGAGKHVAASGTLVAAIIAAINMKTAGGVLLVLFAAFVICMGIYLYKRR